MSFSDTIFLFFLVLILFGPKKLPEMARQAGKLLAELRRASNEFRSQIETEIAHLEVEKIDKKQTILPPSQPPPGAVASLSPSPAAIDAAPNHLASPVSLGTPAAVAASPGSNPATSSSSTPPAEPVAESGAPSSRESHV